jgi:hypothetical protein
MAMDNSIMARGNSGRIVLEIDPTLKKQLYALLALEPLTLKDWFIEKAEEYVEVKRHSTFDRLGKKLNEV